MNQLSTYEKINTKAALVHRSCLDRHRYHLKPECEDRFDCYPCRFCGGWHKTTKRGQK